jgi:hypothetical protein
MGTSTRYSLTCGTLHTFLPPPRPAVTPVVEHVSGNTVEFEMGSLVPATEYTVEVYALKDGQKSGAATVDFTTGT